MIFVNTLVIFFYTITINFVLVLLNIRGFNCLLTVTNMFSKRLIFIFKAKTFKTN